MKPLACAALAPLLIAAVLSAQEKPVGLVKESPFASRASATASPAVAANENIEFAGVMAEVGKRTDLIFKDKTTKKSHWIAEGETKEGITVLKYDSLREQVTVKINGAEKTLALRKGTSTSGAPNTAPFSVAPLPTGFNTPAPAMAQLAPPPAVVMPDNSAPPSATAPLPAKPATAAEVQQKQETEARMLVSDLLEIGMAQRKAYEEAQRKASDGSAAQNQSQPPANPPQTDNKPNGS